MPLAPQDALTRCRGWIAQNSTTGSARALRAALLGLASGQGVNSGDLGVLDSIRLEWLHSILSHENLTHAALIDAAGGNA